jgi:protein-S-isoprenylcysteine O-methyltransferase Ste14
LSYHLAARIIGYLWATTTIYWIVRAFGNKRTKARRNRLLRILTFLLLWATFVAIQSHKGLNVPLFPLSDATRLCGVVLCAAGLALAVWARYILGRNWSGFVVVKEDHELIQRGPYTAVRHPLYTGLILALIGTDLALFPTARGLVLIAVWIIAFYIKARSEERILTQEFGEQYARYKQQVKAALIPYLL